MFRAALKDQAGTTSIEYSLITALLAVAIIFATGGAQKTLDAELTKIESVFSNGGAMCRASSTHEEWSLEDGLPNELAGSRC